MRDRPEAAAPESPRNGSRPRSRRVPANVIALGLTSLFTDVSSEMVNAVLPVYLVFQLGWSPLQFGLFDGAYQGITALLRIAGGIVADRRGRYKEVAGLGYALSAICKLGLLVSQAWFFTTGVLLVDRTGKGLRTAPRDALISLSSPKERLAESFGVHRALDTAGALLGPVVAFVLLGLVPRAYDAVFVISFCVALIGLGILFCFVRNRPAADQGEGSRPSWRSALGLLRVDRFRRLVLAGGLLGAVAALDAFLYLVLQERVQMPNRPFPLLFVGTALAYLVLAVPLGRLADRIGRAPVFLAGYVLLAATYGVLSLARPGWLSVVVLLGLLGAYYAATDGVLMAMTSTVLPAELRSSGLAVLTTVSAFTRFLGAVLFGLFWTWQGADAAVVVFLVGLVLALPAATRILSIERHGAPA
ncbi:MAG: MFS transporter [Acidimicrobiia bacterium]